MSRPAQCSLACFRRYAVGTAGARRRVGLANYPIENNTHARKQRRDNPAENTVAPRPRARDAQTRGTVVYTARAVVPPRGSKNPTQHRSSSAPPICPRKPSEPTPKATGLCSSQSSDLHTPNTVTPRTYYASISRRNLCKYTYAACQHHTPNTVNNWTAASCTYLASTNCSKQTEGSYNTYRYDHEIL